MDWCAPGFVDTVIRAKRAANRRGRGLELALALFRPWQNFGHGCMSNASSNPCSMLCPCSILLGLPWGPTPVRAACQCGGTLPGAHGTGSRRRALCHTGFLRVGSALPASSGRLSATDVWCDVDVHSSKNESVYLSALDAEQSRSFDCGCCWGSTQYCDTAQSEACCGTAARSGKDTRSGWVTGDVVNSLKSCCCCCGSLS